MKLKKIIVGLVILLAALLGMQQLYASHQASDGVDVRQAQFMHGQGALLLDVREPDEYAAVHVRGATLIPLGQLESRLAEIAAYKDKPVLAMCHSGYRSSRAVNKLREAGFTRVSNVSGGIVAWQKAGLAVVKK